MNAEDVRQLVNHRLHEAREAIKDADCLLNAGRSRQGIANRLYYAMFYAGLALLQQIGKTPSKHTAVISLVDTEYVLKGRLSRELSKAFHRAFEMRQASDYRAATQISDRDLANLRLDAETFVAAAAELLDNDELEQEDR